MNIPSIIPNNFNKSLRSVQYKKEHSTEVSFKRSPVSADDSKISWKKIFLTSALAFGITAVITLGIKHRGEGFTQLWQWACNQLNTFKNSFTQTSKKIPNQNNIYPDGKILKLDAQKLRLLPDNVLKQAKEALNSVVTSDDLQRVLREFNIGV